MSFGREVRFGDAGNDHDKYIRALCLYLRRRERSNLTVSKAITYGSAAAIKVKEITLICPFFCSRQEKRGLVDQVRSMGRTFLLSHASAFHVVVLRAHEPRAAVKAYMIS